MDDRETTYLKRPCPWVSLSRSLSLSLAACQMATLSTAKAQVESFPFPTQVNPVTRKAILCGDPPIDRSLAARECHASVAAWDRGKRFRVSRTGHDLEFFFRPKTRFIIWNRKFKLRINNRKWKLIFFNLEKYCLILLVIVGISGPLCRWLKYIIPFVRSAIHPSHYDSVQSSLNFRVLMETSYEFF